MTSTKPSKNPSPPNAWPREKKPIEFTATARSPASLASPLAMDHGCAMRGIKASKQLRMPADDNCDDVIVYSIGWGGEFARYAC